MKIAIPLFGKRVSPRFDCAAQFLILTVKNGNIVQRENLLLKEKVLRERIKRLSEIQVDTLICSGIDSYSEEQLFFHGMRVLSWITGEVEDVIRCFLEGNLKPGMMMGADGRCCGHWRFRHCKGPCGGGRHGHH